LLTKAETVTVAAIEAGVPTLIEAREIIAEFHLMIRRKTEGGLIPWTARTTHSRKNPRPQAICIARPKGDRELFRKPPAATGA
jgi:hypothetical protein